MKRTRKWSFVAQEATRLADLGLSALEIGRRLGVNKSTVTRWMAQGKIARTRSTKRAGSSPTPPEGTRPTKSPEDWAKSVREDYALDATDEQLVTLGEEALRLSLNLTVAPHVRMTAAGRFQAIVRQLALVTRGDRQPAQPETPAVPSAPEKPVRQVVRRSGGDPRKLLMAVK